MAAGPPHRRRPSGTTTATGITGPDDARPVILGRRTVGIAALAGLALLAGCDADPPDPQPTETAPSPYPEPGTCDVASPGIPEPEETSVAVASRSTVGRTWAGMPVGQALLTTETQQYVAFYDAERRLTLAQRAMGKDGVASSGWRRRSVGETLGWDSHNYVTLAVDRDGALHAAGNMHGDPLVYFRTDVSGDIATVSRVATMTAADREQEVTYPVFLRGQDGELYFYFRDGTAGSGATYMNRYEEKSRSWGSITDGLLFDPDDGATGRNAYQTRPVLGPDGYFHTVWVWRDTVDVSTNSMLTYARTQDFLAWETSAGEPVEVPFTYGTGDVVDPVEERQGIVNGLQAIGFDEEDRLVVTYQKYDDSENLQLWAARPEGGGWEVRQLTQWDNPMEVAGKGTLSLEFDLGPVQPVGGGALSLEYSCREQGLTLTVDSDLQFLSQQMRRSEYPAELLRATGDVDGLTPRIITDLGSAHDYEPRRRFVLRWESLGTNGDQARETWPEHGSVLEVIDLGEADAEVDEVETDPQGETE